jgi:hypothetical protein
MDRTAGITVLAALVLATATTATILLVALA